MSTSRKSEDQDPDYAEPGPSNGVQQKIIEETARANAARKITEIVDREFSKEIDAKEKEIFEIQNRLDKALKTLHFLRYVIITDFYNRKQCLATSTNDSKQTRIHPAIKKVIGKSPKCSQNLQLPDEQIPSTSKCTFINFPLQKSPEKLHKNSEKIKNPSTQLPFGIPIENGNKKTERKRNLPKESDVETLKNNFEPPRKIPRHIPPTSTIPESQGPSRGDRYKTQKWVIVGNISKWIPPDCREDAASHKWTVYVRGTKEDPTVTEFFSKVRFLLHPSYQPNDVVEVTAPPFNLTRRGWGEFPVRVQVHFRNSLNKPMDIIHHLKLDSTYTGLQTLGSETLAKFYLITRDITDHNREVENGNEDHLAEIKQEPLDHDTKIEIPGGITIKEEKNDENIEQKLCHVHFEHDYIDFATLGYKFNRIGGENITIEHSPPSNQINGHSIDKNSKQKSDEFTENVIHEKISQPDRILKPPNNNDTLKDISTVKNNLNNLKKCSDVKTLASALDSKSPMLQPLKINIPATFESLQNQKKTSSSVPVKKILLMNDRKIVPVTLFDSKIEKPKIKIENGENGESIITRMNHTAPKKGISLLKKTPINVNTQSTKNSVLNIRLDPSKSLLLNSNSNIPALKIVDQSENLGLRSSNNGKLNDVIKENTMEFVSKIVKTKITVGKDRAKLFSKTEHYEEILKSIDNIKIVKTEALLRFIVKRIPLITENASDPDYKKIHPYSCKSDEEFLNYHVGKQRALEWYRAKTIRSLLKKKHLPEEEIWTVKELMIWCRFHGYTPIRSSIENLNENQKTTNDSSKESLENSHEGVLNTCKEPVELIEWMQSSQVSKKNELCQDDEIIDIESVDIGEILPRQVNRIKEESEKDLVMLEVPKEILGMQNFVCETARRIGVKLESEEIVPGISHPAASRVIVKAVECLLDELLRSSFAKSFERNTHKSCPESITLNDVRSAILSREEFDIFTNSGLGTQQTGD